MRSAWTSKKRLARFWAASVAGFSLVACAGQGATGDTGQSGQIATPGKVYSRADITKCSSPGSNLLRIGADIELSGAQASNLGVVAQNTLNLVSAELNSKGGIQVGSKCYKVEFVMKDNRSDTAAAIAAAIGLIQDEKIKYILGPTSGLYATKTADITQAVNPPIIEISPASSWYALGLVGSPDHPGLFDTSPDVRVTMPIFVAGLKSFMPNVKKIALLWQDDSTTTGIIDKVFLPHAEQYGFTIVANVKFPPGTTDFSSYLTKIKASQPDLLFEGWPPPVQTQIVRQVIEQQAAPAIWAWAADVGIALKEATGSPIPIPMYSGFTGKSVTQPQTQELKDFATLYSTFTKLPVSSTTVNGLYYYDPVFMLVKAIQLTGNVDDVVATRQNLAALKWNGVIGQQCWSNIHGIVFGPELAFVKDGRVTWKELPLDKSQCATT